VLLDLSLPHSLDVDPLAPLKKMVGLKDLTVAMHHRHEFEPPQIGSLAVHRHASLTRFALKGMPGMYATKVRRTVRLSPPPSTPHPSPPPAA